MKIKILLIVALITSLCGCQALMNYKTNVSQGNQLSIAEMKQVRRGMSKEQVLRLIGSPVYETPIESDNWHYIHDVYVHGNHSQTRLSLIFSGNRVIDIQIVSI